MAGFQQVQVDGRAILYDPQLAPQIDARWFDEASWRARGAWLGGAPGRGTSAFLRGPLVELVWRHYRRGGMIGRLVADRYLWTGLERTRPWREFHLLERLHSLGLPVPRPVAASVVRQGPSYRADLISERLAQVQTLAELLLAGQADARQLVQVGVTIRRFHAAGLDHADLNARNILIRPVSGEVFLIDFDRCQLSAAEHPRAAQANLRRLGRSLRRLAPAHAQAWLEPILQGHREQQP